MTTRSSDVVAESMRKGATSDGDAAATASRLAAVFRGAAGNVEDTGETVAGAARTLGATVAGAPDNSVLVAASLSAGVAIGVLLGGGARLVAAGAMLAAVALGAELLQRPQVRHRTRLATPVN